jgi:hypothetical protein
MTATALAIRTDQTLSTTDPLQLWDEAVDRLAIEGVLLTEQQLKW